MSSNKGFSKAEQEAMKERARELKKEAKLNAKREDGEKDLLEKISEMEEPDRSIATRLHEIITENAPDLFPKTWYGMPAYTRDEKVVCHYQSATKFNTRYATLGFSDSANLDEGAIWPVAFGLTEMTPVVEKKIVSLLRQALS